MLGSSEGLGEVDVGIELGCQDCPTYEGGFSPSPKRGLDMARGELEGFLEMISWRS